MATKAELSAYASDVGVDVSDSWTKADIEAALTNAGYDPTTVGDATVAEEPDTQHAEDDLEGTSSDASFANYAPAPTDRSVDIPAPGPAVEQHRGYPDEGGGTVFSANRGNRG